MNPKIKNILIGLAILLSIGGIVVGIGALVTNINKKKQEEEAAALLDIARKEGSLSPEGYDKLRKLLYLDNYNLPASLQNAFDKIKPLLESAGTGIRSGYAVSSMQYFSQIRSIIATEPAAVQHQYNTVESLLQDAFKLNATSTSSQEKLNSANQKSIDWWGVVGEVIFPIPSAILKTTIMPDHSDLLYAFKRMTEANPSPESKDFDKRLYNESIDTLKLFSEAYKALSGGKDYFQIAKNPKA